LLPKLAFTVTLTLALTSLGALARVMVGRKWGWALYGAAIYGSAVTLWGFIAASGPSGLLEATMLLYSACALIIALVEGRPLAALAPAIYAGIAAVVQPSGQALLPLAIGLAAAAYAVSRLKGPYWALPLYGAALLAGANSAWQSQAIPSFQPLALLILAV